MTNHPSYSNTRSTSFTITQAVRRSISHNEIVTLDVRDHGLTIGSIGSVCAALFEICDGDVLDAERNVHEYWGTTEDSDGNKCEWRVHVSPAVVRRDGDVLACEVVSNPLEEGKTITLGELASLAAQGSLSPEAFALAVKVIDTAIEDLCGVSFGSAEHQTMCDVLAQWATEHVKTEAA